MDSSDSLLQPPLKNQKTSEEGSCVDVDRINQLDDGVICQILSFVTPTKYSIRTSVLSKRWRKHLWALSPKFDLELHPCKIFKGNRDQYSMFKKLCVDTFARSVDKLHPCRMFKKLCVYTFARSVDNIFLLRDCLNIETFKLHVPIIEDLYSLERPSSWISACVMCNIRELDIQIGRNGEFDLGELPRCLFTCKSLAVLKLSGPFLLKVTHNVCLPNLKTLRFEWITYLDDSMFPKLLSGCPLLEDLQIVIIDWDPIWIFTIGHSSLKRLYLHCDREEIHEDDLSNEEVNYEYKFVVDAPNLEFIDLCDDLLSDTLFKPLPNIDEAHIVFLNFTRVLRDEPISIHNVHAFFESIVQVRRLFLSEETCSFLSYDFCVFRSLSLPIFCNLVLLEMCHIDFPIELVDLLRHYPLLEALRLQYTGPWFMDDNEDIDQVDVELAFDENKHEGVPGCLRHSLKTIQILGFGCTNVGINTVKYLLDNAMVLETMTIYWLESTRRKDIQGTLTNYPRLSTDCQLVFISHGSD